MSSCKSLIGFPNGILTLAAAPAAEDDAAAPAADAPTAEAPADGKHKLPQRQHTLLNHKTHCKQ